MKQLIHEVIELDKHAQAEINALKKEKEELFLAFKDMKKELSAKNSQETLNEVKALETKAKQMFEARLLDVQSKSAAKEAKIKNYYAAHKDAWLEELMAFVTKN